MSRSKKEYVKKIGLPPGSLFYVGKKRSENVTISEIDFSDDFCEVREVDTLENNKAWHDDKVISWVDINGIHDTNVVEKIGKQLKLDELIMEDLVNTNHRPKMEETNDLMCVILQVIAVSTKGEVEHEQISLVLSENGVVTFQESSLDYFSNLRNRIISKNGTLHKRTADFLFYRMLDTIVDNYFMVTEYFEDMIEVQETKLIENPDEAVQREIYELKNKIHKARKTMVAVRELISAITRSDTSLIADANQKYYMDVYEHMVQIIDTLDSQRETVNDFLNLYMTTISNKMNEVMKVLTIFAAIFIPLTFIAGIYGMNFEFMPELSWKYGYFVTWGVIILVAAVLLNYFRRKKWL